MITEKPIMFCSNDYTDIRDKKKKSNMKEIMKCWKTIDNNYTQL